MAESPPTPTALDNSTATNMDSLNEVLAGRFDFNDFLRNAALQFGQANDDHEMSPPNDEDSEIKAPPVPRNAKNRKNSTAAGSAASATPNSATMTTASALACLGAPHPVASQFSAFQPIRPVYAPSGYGRQILIYDSRSHPGHRREFAYKTRFTNQSGLTTVYYRCMACRALRHRLQRCLPKENLPAVPCIAVKNELLINDPDFPEASDHFCTPLTIDESNHRLKVTFERGFKRARMKAAAEEATTDSSGQKPALKTPKTVCEPGAATAGSPLSLEHWAMLAKNFSSVLKDDSLLLDETAHSTTSSNETKEPDASPPSAHHHVQGGSSTGNSAHSITPHSSPSRLLDDTEMTDNTEPRSQLDTLLRLEDQRMHASDDRNKSHSPDENLNVSNFPKLFEPGNDFAALFGLTSLLASSQASQSASSTHQTATTSQRSHHSGPTATATVTIKSGSELAKALGRSNGRHNSTSSGSNGTQLDVAGPQMNDFMKNYLKNNWQLPEDSAANARSSAELTCSLILALARNIPQAAASMKQNKIFMGKKTDFVGEDLYGKTLAIIGLGRVGMEVASRMQAFGMKVIGFDPLVKQEEAEKKQIKWCQLEDLWPQADYITLHVPLLPQTTQFVNRQIFAKCKQNFRLINTARGGLINETDLLDALNSGQCSGAAIDVFGDEQKPNRSLVQNSKVICTPHLNAATMDSQRLAMELAENLAQMTNGSPNGLFGALNASALAVFLDETKVQYVTAATNLGQLLATVTPTPPKTIHLKHPAAANGLQKALLAGTVVGLMYAKGKGYTDVSLMNAEQRAKQEGITVEISQSNNNELSLSCGQTSVTGCPSSAGTLICSISGSKVPVPVIAMGILAITFNTNGKALLLEEKYRSKTSVEYGLNGGGRLALFSELPEKDINELSQFCSVVKFA